MGTYENLNNMALDEIVIKEEDTEMDNSNDNILHSQTDTTDSEDSDSDDDVYSQIKSLLELKIMRSEAGKKSANLEEKNKQRTIAKHSSFHIVVVTKSRKKDCFVIPSTWLIGNHCLIPPKNLDFERMSQEKVKPREGWEMKKIVSLGEFESFSAAKLYLPFVKNQINNIFAEDISEKIKNQKNISLENKKMSTATKSSFKNSHPAQNQKSSTYKENYIRDIQNQKSPTPDKSSSHDAQILKSSTSDNDFSHTVVQSQKDSTSDKRYFHAAKRQKSSTSDKSFADRKRNLDKNSPENEEGTSSKKVQYNPSSIVPIIDSSSKESIPCIYADLSDDDSCSANDASHVPEELQTYILKSFITSRTPSPPPNHQCSCHCCSNYLQLYNMLKKMGSQLKAVKKLMGQTTNNSPTVPTENVVTLLPRLPSSFPLTLPVNDMEGLDILEEYLKDDDNLIQTVSYFSTFGGKTQRQVLSHIMITLLSNSLSLKLNWRGRGNHGKLPFCSYKQIHTMVYIAAKKNHKCADINMQIVEDYIKAFLRFAPDRDGGRSKRSAV